MQKVSLPAHVLNELAYLKDIIIHKDKIKKKQMQDKIELLNENISLLISQF